PCVQAHSSQQTTTTLCAMATEGPSPHRGTGLSRMVLSALRDKARIRGLDQMIAPARPTLKHRYPLTSIQSYVRWKRSDGTPFDPWIRTHWRLGAELLTTEPCAMTITGTASEWEEWTGMAFPETGDYIVLGAVAPVAMARERDG